MALPTKAFDLGHGFARGAYAVRKHPCTIVICHWVRVLYIHVIMSFNHDETNMELLIMCQFLLLTTLCGAVTQPNPTLVNTKRVSDDSSRLML